MSSNSNSNMAIFGVVDVERQTLLSSFRKSEDVRDPLRAAEESANGWRSKEPSRKLAVCAIKRGPSGAGWDFV